MSNAAERLEVETGIPFRVVGVSETSDPDIALVLTFYRRKLGPDVHFGLTQEAAATLADYLRETLGESEVFGP
jgi:hypothetical protein